MIQKYLLTASACLMATGLAQGMQSATATTATTQPAQATESASVGQQQAILMPAMSERELLEAAVINKPAPSILDAFLKKAESEAQAALILGMMYRDGKNLSEAQLRSAHAYYVMLSQKAQNQSQP